MIDKAGLQVPEELATFIEAAALPGTGLKAEDFWRGAAAIFAEFAPANATLLADRDAIQNEIDAWHIERAGKPIDQPAYQAFLREIGYLVPEPAPFTIDSTNVDPEVGQRAGPQLVVRSSTHAFCSMPPTRIGEASMMRSTAPTRAVRLMRTRLSWMGSAL